MQNNPIENINNEIADLKKNFYDALEETHKAFGALEFQYEAFEQSHHTNNDRLFKATREVLKSQMDTIDQNPLFATLPIPEFAELHPPLKNYFQWDLVSVGSQPVHVDGANEEDYYDPDAPEGQNGAKDSAGAEDYTDAKADGDNADEGDNMAEGEEGDGMDLDDEGSEGGGNDGEAEQEEEEEITPRTQRRLDRQKRRENNRQDMSQMKYRQMEAMDEGDEEGDGDDDQDDLEGEEDAAQDEDASEDIREGFTLEAEEGDGSEDDEEEDEEDVPMYQGAENEVANLLDGVLADLGMDPLPDEDSVQDESLVELDDSELSEDVEEEDEGDEEVKADFAL